MSKQTEPLIWEHLTNEQRNELVASFLPLSNTNPVTLYQASAGDRLVNLEATTRSDAERWLERAAATPDTWAFAGFPLEFYGEENIIESAVHLPYSTTISAAWLLVEHLRAIGVFLTINPGKVYTLINASRCDDFAESLGSVRTAGFDVPETICIMFLTLNGVEFQGHGVSVFPPSKQEK